MSIKTKWKLSYGNNSFKLLGIHFKVDLCKMVEETYKLKITQMEKIIKQWEKRSVSPIGKITIFKTLIIPIFNLLFISLLNPDLVLSDLIEKFME